MTILHTRIFQRLIIMLCVCTCIRAALNFTDNKTIDNGQEVAQPNTAKAPAPAPQSIATQVDTSVRIDTPPNLIPVDDTKLTRPEVPSVYPAGTENADEDETIEFHFEDAGLDVLVNQMASLYKVTFITDDMITPPTPADKKLIKGNKISFKTNKPLTRKAAWNIFLTFLELAGFTLTKESKPNIYRVVSIFDKKIVNLPTFIGTKPELLPKNDQMIRYVYFLQNASLATIEEIIKALKSTAAPQHVLLTDFHGFILTDKAYNIVSLMQIITELDRVTMPQSMSVMKLRRANAKEVKDLYEQLIGKEKHEGVASRLFPARKQSNAVYFPENLRIIADERANALILLGSEDAIKKIEEFVTKHVDVDITAPYPPIRVHKLKYADAETVAGIMNDMSGFGKDTPAGIYGGVRGDDKYIKKMNFTAEKGSNRLIIQGDEEDYVMVKEILAKLDEPQPQVAIEVLILAVSVAESKQLGVQLRSKTPGGVDGLVGPNVKFQTSGMYGTSGIQTSSAGGGANLLLGNLINLAVGASPGNTLVSLGQDLYGVWGLLQALQSVTNTQVVANPFLVATNKTPASVQIGQTRRVVVANVVATSSQASQDDKPANLMVKFTPQINSDGMIKMDLEIQVNSFADPTDFTSATVNVKYLKTSTIVSSGEVLALGGLIQNTATENRSQTPVLGNIPILGWLFKNRQDSVSKDNLLILICPRILPAESSKDADKFTNNHIIGYRTTLADMMAPNDPRDPINRFFFERKDGSADQVVEEFLFTRSDNTKKNTKPQKKNLQKNQQARKRSNRNSFTQDPKGPNLENEMVDSQATAAMKQNEIAVAHAAPPESEPAAPTSKKLSVRSPQRGRRSLSTLIEDTQTEGVS